MVAIAGRGLVRGWKGFTLAVDPSRPGTLYAGGGFGAGLFKSVDGGASWQQILGGVVLSAWDLLVEPGSGLLYIGTSGGLVVSPDGGLSWRQLAGGVDFDAVAVDGGDR